MQRQLLTDDDRALLPGPYETEQQGDAAVAYVRLSVPGTYWEWFIVEAAAVVEEADRTVELSLQAAADRGLRAIGDRDETGELVVVLFFGLVNGHDVEMGYFSLGELLSITGFPVVRDNSWQARPMGEVRALVDAKRAG